MESTTLKRTKGGGHIRQSQVNATWSDLDESLKLEPSQTQSFESFLSPRYTKSPQLVQSSSNALISSAGIKGTMARSPISPRLSVEAMLLHSRIGIQSARSLPEGAVSFDRALSQKGKNELLSRNKLRELLEKLRTDDFVGTIDMEFHSPYLESPDEIAPIPETLHRCPSEDSLSDVSDISEDGNRSKRTSHSEKVGCKERPLHADSSFSI
jgi:hypothetical protein